MLKLNKNESTTWEIVRFYFDVNEKDSIIELHGYRTEKDATDAKTGVRTVVEKLKFSFSGVDFPDVTKPNLIKEFEKKIKTLNNKYGVDWTKAV